MLIGLHLSSLLFYILFVGLPHAGEALVVQNASPVTLPIARRLNMTGAPNIVKLDQARAKALKEGIKHTESTRLASMTDISVMNGVVSYVASVGVGAPPTYYSLIVDTGSSNTWLGAGKKYVRTRSSEPTANRVTAQYGSGSFDGKEYIDTVTLGAGFAINNQSIGVAYYSSGFNGVDGILGIGPVDLTCGTLFPARSSCIPTVTNNAFEQRLISNESIGISFVPTTTPDIIDGALTFGSADTSKYTGDITYVDITSTSPANRYVGIDQSITYGQGGPTILPETAGIVDTGTTLLMISSDAFAAYRNLTGATTDINTGLLRITAAQFENLKSLFFVIDGTTYEFTPNAQIFPRALNTAIGGKPDSIYLIISDLGTRSGEGLDFINGMAFLQRFYHVYDSGQGRVGFANTQYTNAMSN